MTDPTRRDRALSGALALEALTELLVASIEDDADDSAAILERRATLLAEPFEGAPPDGQAATDLEAIRTRVEALEQTALGLLRRRVVEAQAALTALEASWAATLGYLEEPALPPLVLDRQE